MRTQIKIMHIAQSSGGVERYLQMFLSNIKNEKLINILICSNDYNEENYKGLVDNFEHVEMCREIDFLRDIKGIVSIRKLIRKYRPDILYLHSSKAGALGRIANLGIDSKVIYNAHGWAFNISGSRFKSMLYLLIEKCLAIFTDSVVTISKYEYERAVKRRVCSEKKITVIYNGIDFIKLDNEEKKVTRKELNIPIDAYVVGYVGRISRQKAPDVFIEAAAKIKEKIPNAYFVIVGTGEDEKKILKFAAEKKIDSCLYISGWVDNAFEYIKLFNQALLLSRWEGFGLVLAEYMYAKVPVIATGVDAIPEIVEHEKTGLLIDVDRADQVVDAVLKIYHNSKIKNKMISDAYQKVKSKFSIDRLISEHVRLFETLLS